MLTGTPPLPAGLAAYAPRRTVLDAILVDAAVRAGAKLRESFTVGDMHWYGGHVVGIAGRDDGRSVREQARMVVGADGRRSLVARRVGATAYEVVPCQTCTDYTYWEGVDVRGFEAYSRAEPGRVVLTCPTDEGAVFAFFQWPVEEFRCVRADIAGSTRTALAAIPGLAERFAAGRRVARFAGTADQDNYFRVPHGPGWALAGDAGYHRDPRAAFGIKDAFRDAAALAQALDAGLTGRTPMSAALATYHRERVAAVRPGHEATLQAIAFAPLSPAEVRLRAALRGNQADTGQYSGLIIDTVAREAFATPENLARITAGHAASPASQG